jgi:hypothetical protein
MTRVAIVFAAILAFFGLILAVVWLSKPTKLTFNSCASCRISVAVTVNGASVSAKGFPKTAQGSFTTTTAGEYTFTVTDSSAIAVQRIVLSPHKTVTASLVPQPQSSITRVAAGDAYGLAAPDNSHLFFLQASDGGLYELVGNSLHPIDTTQSFLRMSWADSSYGVAQDQGGQLWLYNGSAVTQLSQPNGSTFPNFAVAPNKELYLFLDGTLYRASPGSALQKFASVDSDDSPTFMAAAGGNVALLNDADEPGEGGGVVLVYSDSGKKTEKAGGSFITAWSPSGTSLLTSSTNGAVILNSKLHQTNLIAQSGITNAAWINDTWLVYSVAGQLWLYNANTGGASLLASTTGGAVTQLAISDDHSTAYIVARSSISADDTTSFIGEVALPTGL